MNEEAFNTMYMLAQKEGYKKTPEEFKTLLSSNQEAFNTMYSIAQREGYKKTPEEFKTLLGVGIEEGKPVNFTEGSVEQQEQPTEPLEKPIVDVDRFGVPETDEYLSGAREAAAKKLKETEELLISADIPDLPKHVIDYPSYNVEQLDSALTDIGKREKQTNFILSTRGLTQPQRTEAKKQIERLEEERAAAIVYKAEKTNDYSLVGDAVQAVKDVGYSSAIGKKLRPEVYKLESRVSEDIFKEIEGVDIYDLTEIDFNGIRRADVDKVADLADKVAESIADGNPGVRQIAYEKILNEAEEYDKTKKIKEKIESDAEIQDILSNYRTESLSEFESTNDDGIKYRAELVSTVDSINNNAQSRLNKLVLDYNSDVDLYKQELISQVQQGIITNKEANKQLKDYNTQLYSELESSNNLVIENNKKDIEEVSKEYYKKIEGGFNQFLLDNPMDPSDVEKLQASMKKIYEEVDEGEFAYLKAQENLQSLMFGSATSLVTSLGKSYYTELGRAVSSKGTLFNLPWMTELGDEMMTSFSVADERVEDWSDLANVPAVVKSVGRLAGSATTSIVVGGITSAATGGLGTIPAMSAVATASLLSESVDMAGGIKRDIIKETGSLLKGEQGAEAMWKAQMGNWWTYLFDGLPYVGKALRGVSSKAAKIGIVGLESSATETVQETRQTAQEQKIMQSVMSGEEISARGFGELITPGLVKSTFLEVAPGSFFLGGSTRAVTEFMMDKKANKLAKEIIVKTRAGLVDNTDSFIRQKIFASMNQFGKNFTNSWLATLQKNGAITEEELGKLYTYSKTAEGFLRNVKGLNLTEEQMNTYFTLSNRANELYDKAESITDDKVTRATLTEQANALKKNAQDFLNNPETGGSFVSVKIGKSPAIIMNEEQAIEFVTNNPYVVLPESEVDIVARNADEFGGILEQMAKGVEAATEAEEKERGFFGKLTDKVFKKEKIEEDVQLAEEQKEQSIQSLYNEQAEYYERSIKEYQKKGNVVLENLYKENLEKLKSQSPKQFLEQELEISKTMPEYYSKKGASAFRGKEYVQESVDKIYQIEKLLGVTATEQEVKERQDIIDSTPKRAELEAQQQTLKPDQDAIQEPSTEAVEEDVTAEFTPTEEVSETVETISPLSERLKNVRVERVGDTFDKGARGEAINEKEIEEAQSVLMDELNEIEKSNLPQEQKDAASAEVEKLFNELENYELTTETKTRKITQKRPTRVVREGVKEQTKSPQERSVGRKINIVEGTEFTQEGFVPQEGETIVLEEQDGKIVLQEFDKDGNRTGTQELELENVNDLELVETLKDDDGRVIGATVRNKNNDAEVFSIMDEELALDYAIEKTKAEVGEMSIEEESVFEEYEEVKKRPTKKKPTKEVVKEEVTEKVEPTKPITEETLTEEETSALDDILGFSGQKKRVYTDNKSESDKRRLKRVNNALDKIEDSFQKIFPNLYIGIAEDSDMFASFAKEQGTSKESRSRGVFTPIKVEGEPTRYGIILNPDFANVTTAFHEAFHALMKVNGFNNEQARAVTSRMIKSVQKGATPELKENLETFVSQYETPEQSEEYMAELFGILSYNYSKQSGTVKGTIKRWLRKLAEILGLKPKNTLLSSVGLSDSDAATVNMLNVLADKMSRGKVLSKEDVTALRMGGPLTAQQVAADMRMDEELGITPETESIKKSKKQPEKNKKLKEAIEFAKDNNLSPKKLNNYLLSKGYTQEEIDEATPVKSKPKESIKKLINKVSRLTDNNEARAIVAKELRELLKDSKLSQFSKRTINKVITSLKNTNVSNMQKMLDKVDDAISNDEGRAERIKRYKNRSIAIKRIAKIGPLKELQDPFIRMMGIDPKYLSKEAQKEYDSVLSDILNINKKYDKTSRDTFKTKIDLVLDSYDIDSVRAKEIADRINELIDPTKTLNTNLSRLEKDKKITKEERELITRFKSLLDESSVADPMAGYTEEEIEEYKGMLEAEKRESIEEDFIETLSQPQSAFYSADDTGAFKLSEEERRYVKEANSITLKDIQELSLRDAKSVVRALEAMKAGFLTPELFQGVIKVRGVRGNMSIPLNEIKQTGVVDKISSKISSSILNIGRKKKITGIGDRLRSAPTKNYEQVLKTEKELLSDGSKRFKGTNIYKSLFKPTSTAFSKSERTLNRIEDKLKNATALLSRNQNERFIQKAKVAVFQVQREYDSNVGKKNKEVNQAKDWINATIKDKDTAYDERDIRELEKIRDRYLTDGQVDAKKLYDSLTANEKKHLQMIDEVYEQLTSMARMDAAVQGMPFIHRENYIHLPKSGTKTSEISNDFEPLFNSFMNASVKNKAAIQRTGKTHSISFDPVSNAYAAARKIVVGYHMYPVIKSTRIAFSGLKNRAETRFEKDLVNELESIYDRIINSQYKNVTKNKILADNIFRYLTKAGYFSQLSGVFKAAWEFGSNTLHAVMNHAGGLVDGYATLVSVDTKTIDKALENTDTTQMDRLTKTAKFDNKDIEGKLLSKAKLFNPEQMTGELAASAKTVGKVAAMPFQTVFKINESLITKPDEMVIRPLFVGEFQNRFKQLTGQKLNWEKLANDELYRDRFQEAINQASEQADSAVIDTSASTNPFDTIPSNISDPDADNLTKAIQVVNRYMTNFRVFEYYSAVKGVQNLFGKGEISPVAGFMLLASTIMRMSIYRLGIDYAFGLIFSMLGMDEDEDEIKEEDLTRSVLSGIVTLAFGRNLGNLTQSVVNLGIEFANMEFGEGITWDSVTKDGEKTEYDPYKDSMVFSKIPVKRSPGRDLFTDFLISSAGPLTPTIKSVRRATTLTDRSIYNNTKESRDKNKNELFFKTPFDIAGSLGFIPNYKELKKINDRYWFGGNRDTEKKTTEKKTKGKILGRTRTQSSRTSSTGRKAPRSNRTR